jgi:modification methylase
MSVIRQCLYRWQNKPVDKKTKKTLKVTAKWIEELAQKEAWHIKLKRYATDNLKSWVGGRQRIELFQNINQGNFGDEETQAFFDQFKNAIGALNGKAPRLYVGKAENMTEIENESIDIIITSPPYNLGESNWPMGGDGRKARDNGIGYDKHEDAKPEGEYQDWQIQCLIEMYRVAKSGASLFYNHKVRNRNNEAIFPHQWLLRDDNPWTVRQEILWDRTSTHNHNPDYFYPEDERIYWMVKGKRPNLYNSSIGASIVWRFHGPQPNTPHPAPFPEELPRRCLKAIGGQNLVVLDPFAGGCTTLRVALSEFGFESIGYDVSREYLETAREENKWMNSPEI